MAPSPRDLLIGALAGALAAGWWMARVPAPEPVSFAAAAVADAPTPRAVVDASAAPARPPACATPDAAAGQAVPPAARAPAAAALPVAAGLHDEDAGVRLQALQLARQAPGGPPLADLRALLGGDPSEAVRIEALEAFVAHPEASEGEVRAQLEQAAGSSSGLLAEQARALLEARAAPAVAALLPEPVEPGF